MSDKKYSPGQAVAKFRLIDVLMAEGNSPHQVCKEVVITDANYHRRSKENGGVKATKPAR